MINCIYFSPTGGVKMVVDILASSLNNDKVMIDLMDKSLDLDKIGIDSSDLSIIAVPSFGGRVPSLAALKLSRLDGKNSRAIT